MKPAIVILFITCCVAHFCSWSPPHHCWAGFRTMQWV